MTRRTGLRARRSSEASNALEDHFYCPPGKAEFENRLVRSPPLKRGVNKRGGVNRETRELERLRPGRASLELENRAETQILANVWDTGRRSDREAVNEIGRWKVRVGRNGSPSWMILELFAACPASRAEGCLPKLVLFH